MLLVLKMKMEMNNLEDIHNYCRSEVQLIYNWASNILGPIKRP